MKKEIIRKGLRIKRGGRLQISSHGAGEYSVQVIRNGKVRENIVLPASLLREAKVTP